MDQADSEAAELRPHAHGHAETATASQIENSVTAKRSGIWSVSSTPTVCGGATSVTSALDCAESATRANPHIGARPTTSHAGSAKSHPMTSVHAPLRRGRAHTPASGWGYGRRLREILENPGGRCGRHLDGGDPATGQAFQWIVRRSVSCHGFAVRSKRP